MDHLYYFCLFCYAFMHVCLLMPCGNLLRKGWLSFMMSNSDVVTIPLVYRFLIFALFLTFKISMLWITSVCRERSGSLLSD